MPAKRDYYPALDGLRALAVVLVMLSHCELEPQIKLRPGLGWPGVGLFFVLSGFLITDILLRECEGKFAPYWGRFAWRRVLRIFPIYYLLVAIVYFFTPFAHLGFQLAYLSNLWRDPVGKIFSPYLQHTWSLCIEEQFYLVWPLVVWLAGRKHLPKVCVFLIGFAIVFRTWIINTVAGGSYYHTLSQMDQLAFGALLACMYREGQVIIPDAVRWCAWTVVVVTLALCVFLNHEAITGIESGLQFTSILANTAMGAFFALLVACAVTHPPQILQRRFARHIGRISYGLYLWHIPVFILVNAWVMTPELGNSVLYVVITDWIRPGPIRNAIFHAVVDDTGRVPILRDGVAAVLCMVSAYVVALVSWHIIEQPILKLKDWNRQPSQTLLRGEAVHG